MNHNILIVAGSGLVLTASTYVSALQFAHECTMNTAHIAAANYPHYMSGPFPLASVEPRDYPTWRWSSSARKFLPTHPDLVTDQVRARAVLATAKVHAVAFMMARINKLRYKFRTGFDFQDMIYLAKEMQARRLIGSGFDEEIALQSPYVLQYAEDAKMSLQSAAEDILFQAKLGHEVLARSEKVRMKYLGMLKKAATPEEVNAAVEALKNEPVY